jgi:hypothetical protein
LCDLLEAKFSIIYLWEKTRCKIHSSKKVLLKNLTMEMCKLIKYVRHVVVLLFGVRVMLKEWQENLSRMVANLEC